MEVKPRDPDACSRFHIQFSGIIYLIWLLKQADKLKLHGALFTHGTAATHFVVSENTI